jgi:hypothetical protein
MATVLEEYTTKEQNSGVRFLWAKGLGARDIYKEMFPVYSGKYLSHKVVSQLGREVFSRTLKNRR